jgi:phosphatidate cytidylyltransferase
MRVRIITTIVLAPTAIIVVVLGGWWLFALFGIGMLLAAYEYFTMTRQGGYHPLWIPALILIAAYFINVLLQLHYEVAILVIAVALPPLWELTRKDHQGFLNDWALMGLGVLYIAVLGANLFALENVGANTVVTTFNVFGFTIPITPGKQLLFIALLTTWLTDIFAYISGRAFGKNPFFPDISPKKTREGAIGGIVAGTITFAGLGWVVGMPFPLALLGGILIALIGTAGDLVESLIKRNLGVKDSGTLIAGHGGVLDRLDSGFFTLTFAFYYCTLVLGYK